MKTRINLAAILIIAIGFGNCKTTKQQTTGWSYNEPETDGFEQVEIKQKKPPKTAAKYLEGMQLIKGGTFTMGRTTWGNPFDKDSTLLQTSLTRRVTMSNFYINQHEVTNAEYREFVDDVRDTLLVIYNLKQISPDKLVYLFNDSLIPIYPDTSVWAKDYPYTYNEPYINYYFTHPLFDNFPVVGVSWLQANAYCIWRTNRLNEAILKSGGTIEDGYPAFRLPTEAEWEYAALSPDINRDENKVFDLKLFPWDGYKLNNKEGKYLANFGQIKDQNGLLIKEFPEDIPIKGSKFYDFMYTSPVKHFPPNSFNIYDVAGNVAEWTLDVPRVWVWEEIPNNHLYIFSFDSIKQYRNENNPYMVNASDNLDEAISKVMKRKLEFGLKNNLDSTIKTNKAYLTNEAYLEMHDAQMIERNKNARVVKGGSWATGPAYMLCGRREAFPENKGSSRIGFRVAMTKVGTIKKD